VGKQAVSTKIHHITGVGLFVFALVLGVLTEGELSRTMTVKNESQSKDTTFPGIEEIKNNWPNFRGPEGIGIAYTTNVPTQWMGTQEKILYGKQKFHYPVIIQPIVWGKKYFYQAQSGRHRWFIVLMRIPARFFGKRN